MSDHQADWGVVENFCSLTMFPSKIELYSFIFGAFIKLIIPQTARAYIPRCDFSQTVNITLSQRLQNGAYIYQDLEVPAKLTGEFDYIITQKNYFEITESHLRGCVCHLKPCIWICCRFKDWDASNGKCTDGLIEQLSEINPLLKVTLHNGTVVRKNLLKDFIVLRDRMRWQDNWEEIGYSLFEDGSVLPNRSHTSNSRGYDCMHPNQFTSGNTESFVAVFHEYFYRESVQLRPGQKELMLLSWVFLVITIAVYLYVRKLQNLHGKCFICYMITSFICFIDLWLITVERPLQMCGLHGYCSYFLTMAKFTWLLSLSHQMWKGFTSVNRVESQHSFLAYSVFAWGTAALLTGIIFLIDYIWGAEPSKVNWIPGVGWQNCFLKYDMMTAYYDGPCNTLIAVNTALFIWTIFSIIRVKLFLRHFSDHGERARNLSSRMQTYTMFIRLFVAMDIQWTLRIISFFTKWRYINLICLYCDYCMGIIIFVLFIMKRSTIRLLIEEYSQ